MNEKSTALFAEATQLIPGGVNSPVRACLSVGVTPLFIASGKGGHLVSEDGETYVDFVQSWGPLLLGHAHPAVTRAVCAAAELGTSFGAPCRAEVELAAMVVEALPSVEMVRMVNSGTEATMSAVRLARACTGREKIVKFIGGYHGHADGFLVSAGSGVASLSIPGTPGVPRAVVADTLLAPYNDLEAVKALFASSGETIAAIIVEPVAGNMGLVLPATGFLQGLRDICDAHGSLLIFDEVITGFRLAYGGAQERFGILPDLTTMGKIIGGGLPVGAYGGARRFMERIAPSGEVYQAGTLSGNPLAMAAGLATLRQLQKNDYAALEKRVAAHCAAMQKVFAAKGIPAAINTIASMFTIFFTDRPVTDFASAQKSDGERYARLFTHMRAHGVCIAPSGYEAAMVSFAHSDDDLQRMVTAVESFTG